MSVTPNLGITLLDPAQSAKSTTVNTGSNGFDAAAAGTVAIDCTAGGSITVSTSPATPAPQYMYARLKLTGTPTAGFNLIVPLGFPKFYVIDNQSGQTGTVKGTTGTGIAVSTANVQVLYCDGTNVLAVTSPTAGGSASVTMGGDVTGSSSAATVVKIQGNSVLAGAPTDAQLYLWNNTTLRWEAKSLSGDATVTNAGVVTVAKVNGTSVPAAPAAPQVLTATGAAAATWQNLPFDVPIFLKGKPAASDYVTYALAHAINFLANFASGSGATANIAAAVAFLGTLPTAASWVVTINDVAVSGGTLGAVTAIGTITITSAGVVTFATTGGTAKTVVAGHALQFVFPVSQDTTAADFSCTLGGYR